MKPQSILVGVFCLFVSNTALAENWPQWRGLQGDGVSTEKGIATKWSKSENVLWASSLPGQGGATPVVWDDRIFVTSSEGNDDGANLVLICLSARDGRQLWQQKVTAGNQNARSGEGNSASPSPSTDGKHVWVFYSTGVLACYTVDGQMVWKFDVADRYGKLDIQFGMSSTPVLHGDHLYLQLIHGTMRRDDNTRTGKVIKLDKLTGNQVWAVDRITDAQYECKHSYASPFILDRDNHRCVVVHGADCTTGHSLESGEELWRLSGLNGPSAYNRQKSDPTFRFVASPCISGDSIIVPTAKAGPTVAISISDALKGNVTGNNSVVRWSTPLTPDVSIPLVVDGLVYNLHKDGRLQCFDLVDGREIYFERTHTVQHRTSPTYADGHLYFCGKDGRCTVVKAGRKFEIVASNDLGDPITASPVISSGVLYIRTYNHLYAIKKP